MALNPVPKSLAAILDRELEPGEKVVWQAMPSANVTFLHSLIIGVPMIIAGRHAMLNPDALTTSSHSSGDSDPFWLPLLGVALVLGGVWILLFPLWNWWVARHTAYVITDRRAIHIVAPFRRVIQSFMGERLVSFIRNEDRSGCGNIVFGRGYSGSGTEWIVDRSVGFYDLPNAKAIDQLLRTTYENTRRP